MAQGHDPESAHSLSSEESDAVNSDNNSDLDPEYETDWTSKNEDPQQDCKDGRDLAELFADIKHPPEYYI
jgi:hypothetical protein